MMASLARTSIGPGHKGDRTAAHAAVRNLAESYGVDLLPLELKTDITITPVKAQNSITARRSCDLSRSLSLQDEVLPSNSRTALFSISDVPLAPQDQAAAAAAAEDRNSSITTAGSSQPQQQAGFPAAVQSHEADGAETEAVESDPSINSTAVPDDVDDAVEVPWLDNPAYLSEAEYLQYQIPLEQQLLMLEEERDILVDKLLATTAALHASEARNRENQASASQVAALLNQLQGLLRRAEVERDKAKLQLKRQRLSASQIQSDCSASPVVAELAAAGPLPLAAPQLQPTTAAAHESDAGSITNNEAADGKLPQQPLLKKHKTTVTSGSRGRRGSTAEGAGASENDQSSADAVILGSGRHTSGGYSASGSSGSVEQLLGDGEEGDMAVPLMPSSNSVRPPVKSVIHGFEALMKQKAREAAAKAAAAAAARRFGTDASAAAAAAAAAAFGGVAGLGQQGVNELLSVAEDSRGPLPTFAGSDAGKGLTAAAAAGMPPPVVVLQRAASVDSSCSSGPAVQHQLDSSSITSTPTAAAIYNASPTAFAAEAAAAEAAAAGVASLEAAIAASYAEVAKRNSSEWSYSSSSRSRGGSRSPTKRAVRSPRKAVPTPPAAVAAAAAAAAGGGGGCHDDSGDSSSPRMHLAHADDEVNISSCSDRHGGNVFEFRSTNTVQAPSSRLSSSSESQSAAVTASSRSNLSSSTGTLDSVAAEAAAAGRPSVTATQDKSHHQRQRQQKQKQKQQQADGRGRLDLCVSPQQDAGSAAAAAAAVQSLQQRQGERHKAAVHSKDCQQTSMSAALSIAARANSSADAAVQVVEQPGENTADLQTAAAAVDSCSSSRRGSRSSSPEKKGPRDKQQQTQELLTQKQKTSGETSSQDAASKSTASANASAAQANSSKPSSRSSSSGGSGFWRWLMVFLVSALLLAGGGMLWTTRLLTSNNWQTQPAEVSADDSADATVAKLHAQLSFMQQKVVALERQLSETSAACGAALRDETASDVEHSMDDADSEL